VLTKENDRADHAAVRLDGLIYDFDGPLSEQEFLQRFNDNEKASAVGIRPIKKGDLPNTLRDAQASQKIADIFTGEFSEATPDISEVLAAVMEQSKPIAAANQEQTVHPPKGIWTAINKGSSQSKRNQKKIDPSRVDQDEGEDEGLSMRR